MAPRPPRVTERSHVSPRRADGSRGRFGLHVGPVRITPIRTVLAIVFFGSLAYIAWAIFKVEDSTQIPMVTSGIAVLGLVFVGLSVGGAIRMWQGGPGGGGGGGGGRARAPGGVGGGAA